MNYKISERLHSDHIDNLQSNRICTDKSDILDQTINHLLETSSSWLTIGDMIGSEAYYLKSHNQHAIASDLSDRFLRDNKNIDGYNVINAEDIKYPDDSFDYVLCKLSLHHFARPYRAIYEMLRIAKKGIIIIEPVDPLSVSPALLFLKVYLPGLMRLLWKNRISYESVGNYIFKISEREIEKICRAMFIESFSCKKIMIHNNLHLSCIIEHIPPQPNTK